MSQQNRFQDNSSGIITDTKYKKNWLPKDSWGDLGQWRTFEDARRYAQTMNRFMQEGSAIGGFQPGKRPRIFTRRN
jgi:hypothetical protein